jgi:hypothetical protein
MRALDQGSFGISTAFNGPKCGTPIAVNSSMTNLEVGIELKCSHKDGA